MIYTVTTNPSLDYTVEAELIPGRVNRTRSEEIYPGGKGINVAVMLQRFGMESKALGFAAGRIGQMIRDLLDDLGCNHELIELDGDRQSRINVKVKGAAHTPETAINGRGPELNEGDIDRIKALLQDVGPDDAVVISGWTRNIPFYLDLLERANAAGAMTVLDTAGEALWQCLKCRPYLIKPNIHELGALFGMDDLEDEEAFRLACHLQEEGARNVLVSLGARGAFLLTEDQQIYFANGVAGMPRNSVGAGDSLIAGFLTGLNRTENFARALRMGVAAGSATTFCDWLATEEQVTALLQEVKVKRIPFGE